MQRTGAAGIVSVIRTLLVRGSGLSTAFRYPSQMHRVVVGGG
jgi:hypothetical protein